MTPPPTPELTARWESDWESRPGFVAPATRATMAAWETIALTEGDIQVGVIALGVGVRGRPGMGTIADIWILPEHRRRGHASRALAWGRERLRQQGMTSVRLGTSPGSPAQAALFAQCPITARHMTLKVSSAPTLPPELTIRPMAEAAYDDWQEAAILGYAALNAKATPPPAEAVEVARREFAQLLPQGAKSPGNELWTLFEGEEPVGNLWLFHSDTETFIFDVEIDAAHRGKGLGRHITRFAEVRAAEAKLPQVRLHVHEHNTVAVRLYQKLGYQTTMEFRVVPLES